MLILDVLEQRVAARPEHPFILHGNERVSYREFDRRTNQAAHALQALGVHKGDRVTVAMGNSVDYLVAAFGALKAGAVYNPVNPGLGAGELGYILRHAEPAVVVTDERSVAHLTAAEVGLPASAVVAVYGEPPAQVGAGRREAFASIVRTSPDAPSRVLLDAGDASTLLYTSGTTGNPKGVLFHHGSTGAAGKHFLDTLGITADDTILAVTPLFHGNAWGAVGTALQAGGTVAYPVAFRASEFWPLVETARPTVLYTLGTILAILLQQPPSPRERQSGLRVVLGLGSAPIRDQIMARLGVQHVAECFGSTDAGVVTITPLGTAPRSGSAGPPVSGVSIRIVDDDARTLPPRDVGEITVRSPHCMAAYFRDPEQTALTLRDGWFFTGDLGYVDEDGWLYFVDRKKDVIRRGGENMSSVLIEKTLREHPRVADVAVIGVPDPVLGQEVKAFIVANGPVTAEELREFAAARLARFQVPRLWEFRDALPKTPTQRVEKYKLRQEHGGSKPMLGLTHTAMPFTLPEIHDAVAASCPEREAIVSATRRLTWREFQLRTRRVANILAAAGLGCHHERDGLMPWESGHDHLALYLYNGPEYLEGMIGAFRARVAPFNVNYRYVEDELRHLLADAHTRAIIYHAGFAPRLAKVLPHLPPVTLLLQVDDGSGEPLLPGAQRYEEALAAAGDAPLAVQPRPDDLYIVYTGGTTGAPKGVLWRQDDIFFAALGGRIPGSDVVIGSIEELVARAAYGEMMRMLPAPPFMHNAGHWSALITLHQGGTVIIQANPRRLDPDDIWRTIERERVFTLSIVGDAFARPLVDQLRRARYDLSSLKVIGSGGAILSPSLKQALLELLPGVMLFDGFGASETGAQGAALVSAGSDANTAFTMDEHSVVLDHSLAHRLERGDATIGWLARTGHVPLGYLGDEARTRRTYPVIEGVRYAVPGDRAELLKDGTIRVLGRDSACINSGGEKIFAEEVEAALKRHPDVYDVLVTGTPSERWGEQVTAVVALRTGSTADEEALRETAAATLARFKLPRAFVFVDHIARTPSGKPDYRWARETALAGLRG